MSREAQKLVQKLWHFCNVLRDDGMSYPDYCEQLTYLLFLKMAHEQELQTARRVSLIPAPYRWDSLLNKRGAALARHYSKILSDLSKREGILGVIFNGARNKIQDPAKLRLLIIDLIDAEQWTGRDIDIKGEAYEGLLEKNAQDTKSGAGQYFTPRALVRSIVEVVQPAPGETICDPACGTGGFLLTAHEYISTHSRLAKKQREHLKRRAIRGYELVGSVSRLAAMNLMLHGIGDSEDESDVPVVTGDSLREKPQTRFDVVLTNPPFGRKSSITLASESAQDERQTLALNRDDFWAATTNKQLNFVQHVFTLLKPDGRAAIVVPDNVLFEGGAGEVIRRRLMDSADVHTILRLPTGIFYAQGVKANVIFFDRRSRPARKPGALWVYDLRSRMRVTLRTNPLTREDVQEFVDCYKAGAHAKRAPTWTPQSPLGRWRRFSYEEVQAREKCNWDLMWLRDDGGASSDTESPAQIATRMIQNIEDALQNLKSMARTLDSET
ncbi:SAM-dependent DNA methyltransferase [Myxococcus sp. AM009]|uniref:type I restriction-modification system subunit M n=1 Tax=Myxococcus sp. AM009 TaxID=2745137 RepID=UPI001594F6DE|nr:SAM-dependent DNA methyltransferase [Myxococcus sp. AM009]